MYEWLISKVMLIIAKLAAILRHFTALPWQVRFLSKRYSHEENNICSNDDDIVNGGTGPESDDLSGWHELSCDGSGLLGVVQHWEGVQENRSALLAVQSLRDSSGAWSLRKIMEKRL